MSFPLIILPFLPPTTIVPSPVDQEDTFIQYFNRLYEDIAFAMNMKDFRAFTITITTTATDIPNVPNQGAYIICVAGVDDGMPAVTYSMIKTNISSPGTATSIQIQSGTTAPWVGKDLMITSSSTNFQILHNAAAGTFGNFNIRIIGTQ